MKKISTLTSFDKLNIKSLHKDLFDKIENESLCKFFTKFLDGTKNESFS